METQLCTHSFTSFGTLRDLLVPGSVSLVTHVSATSAWSSPSPLLFIFRDVGLVFLVLPHWSGVLVGSKFWYQEDNRFVTLVDLSKIFMTVDPGWGSHRQINQTPQ